MLSWGIMLLIVGIGSFIIPMTGMQFKLIQIFGEGNEAYVGVVFTLVGLLLVGLGLRKPKEK